MFFKQIFMDDTGSLSYIVGCSEAKKACVVNPKRNVREYIDIAEKYNLSITHIFETPDHNEDLSGKKELKFRYGAEICFLEDPEDRIKHRVVEEGEIFEFGNAKLEVINSPGHAPFSNSLQVSDTSRPNEPKLILTRECLFIDDLVPRGTSGSKVSDELNKYLDSHGSWKDSSFEYTTEKPMQIAI